MSRPLALVRPEPGWSASAAAARAVGIEVVGHPLFESEPVAWELPPGDFDALLVGSAAAFRNGGPQLAQVGALPVYAVGASTAAAARTAGFQVVRIGEGGLQALLDDVAGRPMRFLRVSGAEHVALDPHPGQSIVKRTVYRMAARPVGGNFAAALPRSPLVALHSAAAARHFAQEVDRLGIARGALFLLALAPRVAKAAGLGWAAVHLADTPSDAALLAKAAALCS